MSLLFKKREILHFLKDRLALGLLAAILIGVLALILVTGLTLHISDVQLPIRHSDYGITNIYRDKWYARTSFALFGIIILCINGYLAVKAHSIRRGMSLAILSLSLFVIIAGLRVSTAVFGIG